MWQHPPRVCASVCRWPVDATEDSSDWGQDSWQMLFPCECHWGWSYHPPTLINMKSPQFIGKQDGIPNNRWGQAEGRQSLELHWESLTVQKMILPVSCMWHCNNLYLGKCRKEIRSHMWVGKPACSTSCWLHSHSPPKEKEEKEENINMLLPTSFPLVIALISLPPLNSSYFFSLCVSDVYVSSYVCSGVYRHARMDPQKTTNVRLNNFQGYVVTVVVHLCSWITRPTMCPSGGWRVSIWSSGCQSFPGF